MPDLTPSETRERARVGDLYVGCPVIYHDISNGPPAPRHRATVFRIGDSLTTGATPIQIRLLGRQVDVWTVPALLEIASRDTDEPV
jgi:hypothetical protein